MNIALSRLAGNVTNSAWNRRIGLECGVGEFCQGPGHGSLQGLEGSVWDARRKRMRVGGGG